MIRFVSLALLFAATGCSSISPFVYRPEAEANATIESQPAARYEVPPEASRGDVRLASFGVTDMKVKGARSEPVMHLRIILANTSDEEPWILDTRDVRLELGEDRKCPPAYVSVDRGKVTDMPFVQVPHGERRTVDLYYRLPPRMHSERHIQGFDVVWEVRTGARVVAERTPFARTNAQSAPGYGELGFEGGYGALPY